MIITLVAAFAALLFFIGIKWSSAKAENDQLRLQVASLKRQLKQLGRQDYP